MSKPQKRRGKYRVQWLDETGKRRSGTFATHSAATAAARRRRVEVDDIRSGKARPKSSLTVRDASESWLATRPEKRRKANEGHFRVHIWPFMGDKRMSEVSPELVRKLRRHLEAKVVQPPKLKRPLAPGVAPPPPKLLRENTIANVLRTLANG